MAWFEYLRCRPGFLRVGLGEVLAPFAVGDVTYPLARKVAYATEQVAGAISGRNLLHRNVLTSQHQQRTAQAPIFYRVDSIR